MSFEYNIVAVFTSAEEDSGLLWSYNCCSSKIVIIDELLVDWIFLIYKIS